jgi:uncharacterized YigZ family protein
MKNLNTIQKTYDSSLEIKKSQFISYLTPIDNFDNLMSELRNKYPKARHFVWATRVLNEHDQIVENCSDDGEPKNTSGKPTLKVLQGHNLINCGIITVRFFGGIKLGTGGLVRAYNDAGQQTCETAEKINLDSLYSDSLTVPYSEIRQAEYLITQSELTVTDKIFEAESATFTIQGESDKVKEIISKMGN